MAENEDLVRVGSNSPKRSKASGKTTSQIKSRLATRKGSKMDQSAIKVETPLTTLSSLERSRKKSKILNMVTSIKAVPYKSNVAQQRMVVVADPLPSYYDQEHVMAENN